MQNKRPKSAFGLIGPLDKASIQDNFMKKALRQVFGLFIVVPFAAEIEIHGFPISIKQ
jgi:hypothetical protein